MTETQSKSRQKIFLRVFQIAVYVSKGQIRAKWFSLEHFNFIFFSGLRTENIQQCLLLVVDSTCPEESMGNEVLTHHDLILKNVFAFWTIDVGFRLKSFNRVVNTSFYAFREKVNKTFFSKQFLFLNGYPALIEYFSNFWQKVYNGLSIVCSMCPGERFEVKIIFYPKLQKN